MYLTLTPTSGEYNQLCYDAQYLTCVPREAQPHQYGLKKVIHRIINNNEDKVTVTREGYRFNTRISSMFSAGGKLIFTGRQNFLNRTSFQEKLSSRWSNWMEKKSSSQPVNFPASGPQ